MTRLIKDDELDIQSYVNCEPIDKVIENLTKLKAQYGGDAVVILHSYGYDSPEIKIEFKREETDYEYECRLEKERLETERKEKARLAKLKSEYEKAEDKKQKELALLATLKAKYEK